MTVGQGTWFCCHLGAREHDAIPRAVYTSFWRPNLRLADNAAQVAFQLVAVVLPLWSWIRSGDEMVVARRLFDTHATWFVLLFAVPFVLTNADPRVTAASVANLALLAFLRYPVTRCSRY